MTDLERYKTYEPIFGSWHIRELLGEGQFGQVYRIEREDMGKTYESALKIITVPKTRTELELALSDGMTESEATEYYNGLVNHIIEEFAIMSRVKGHSNIVSYEDHQIIRHEDGIGWDILIKMELLKPMYKYRDVYELEVDEVLRIGIDMCKALEICEQNDILHRDIKPENIFFSEFGTCKLGDFGVAKVMDSTTTELSKKGTVSYMAPEVFKGEPYDSRADIYSLGVVLYKMLNHGRLPFMPVTAPLKYSDKESAMLERLSGKPMEPPARGGAELGDIILRACRYDASDRYQTAADMLADLERVADPEHTPAKRKSAHRKSPAKRRLGWFAAVIVLASAILIAVPKHVTSVDTADLKHDEVNEIYLSHVIEPEFTIRPWYLKNAEIEFATGDDEISIDENGVIRGEKTGGATMMVKSGGNLICEYSIEVLPQVEKIDDVEDKYMMTEGDVIALDPKLVVAEACNGDNIAIAYASDNDAVVTVDNKGNITAMPVWQNSEAEITIAAGGCIRKITVIVEPRPVVIKPAPKKHTRKKTNNAAQNAAPGVE